MKWFLIPVLVIGWYVGRSVVPAITMKMWPEMAPHMFGIWDLVVGGSLAFYLMKKFREINLSVVFDVLKVPVGFLALIGLFGWLLYEQTTLVPVELPLWQEDLIILGLSKDTPLPKTTGELKSLVASSMPHDFPRTENSPSRDDCVKLQADEIMRQHEVIAHESDSTLGVTRLLQSIRAQCLSAYERFRLQQLADLNQIRGTTPLALVLVGVLVNFLGVFFAKKVPGIGKLVGHVIWVAAVVWLVTLVRIVPLDAHPKVWELWRLGLVVRALEVLLAFAAVAWIGLGADLNKWAKPKGAVWSMLTKFGVAAVATVVGLNLDSLLQTIWLTQAVQESKGYVTLDYAYFAYQSGLIAGVTITSILASFLALLKGNIAQEELEKALS
jgi:hypothetical protein